MVLCTGKRRHESDDELNVTQVHLGIGHSDRHWLLQLLGASNHLERSSTMNRSTPGLQL